MRKTFTFFLLLFSIHCFSQHYYGIGFSSGMTPKSADYNGRLTESRELRYPNLGTTTYKTSFLYTAGFVYRYKIQKWQAEASLNYQQNNVRTDFSNFHRSLLLRVNTIHPSVAIMRDIISKNRFILSAKFGASTGFTLAKRNSVFENYSLDLMNADTTISKEIININANEPSIRFAGVFVLQAAIPLSKKIFIEVGVGVHSEFNKPNKLNHYEYFYESNPQSKWELALESDRYNERYLFLQFSVFKKIGAK